MADKPSHNSNLSIHSPPPPSTSGSTSNSNAPFTPRSSTFPDSTDSDNDFDVFEPTPVHSPGGPQYDDLPPSYDEAQQQALNDARNGIPPLDLDNVDLHQMRLDGDQIRPTDNLDARKYRVPIQPENTRNANVLGVNVPVQHSENNDQIHIGRVSSSTTIPDPTAVLLNRALEFTHHEPDADARYAPRLTRSIAIPQEASPSNDSLEETRPGRRRRCGNKWARGRGRHGRWDGRGMERGEVRRDWQGRGGRGDWRGRRGEPYIPGQWPETTSTETLRTENESVEEPVQFLRAYAKALHSHSIRPAEFTEFLDGLNALCLATNTTTAELVNANPNPDTPANLVHNYIASTNEAFFAPRGLKVSLQSLSTLINALKIPEERGQRAGAVASVIDTQSTADKRVQALHPWVEPLETNVPSPNTQTLLLREMGEWFRRQNLDHSNSQEEGTSRSEDGERRNIERENSDPPHSIPEEPAENQRWNRGSGDFGSHRAGWGARGGWGHHRGAWSPFGAPGHGPFGPPGHSPFGPPGFGPFGPHHHGPFNGPPRGPHFGRGGRGYSSSRGFEPNAPHLQNNWAQWGESIGKWGEEFGKRMGEWGQQFGKQAEEWGTDLGRRAEVWGDDIAARASGSGTGTTQRDPQEAPAASQAGPEGLAGQETGVHREDDKNTLKEQTKSKKLEKKAEKKKAKDVHDDEDEDASSISSDSSSDSESDSDSDSDSSGDEEEYPNTSEIFHKRIHEINTTAQLSTQKGKKSAQEIAFERTIAIEKAEKEKTALDHKIEEKKSKRALKREFRHMKRDIRREYRVAKRQLRALDDEKGKVKGKRREKSREWKEVKRDYREKRKEIRREWEAARRESREARSERRRMRRSRGDASTSARYEEERMNGMVWMVVENLGT